MELVWLYIMGSMPFILCVSYTLTATGRRRRGQSTGLDGAYLKAMRTVPGTALYFWALFFTAYAVPFLLSAAFFPELLDATVGITLYGVVSTTVGAVVTSIAVRQSRASLDEHGEYRELAE